MTRWPPDRGEMPQAPPGDSANSRGTVDGTADAGPMSSGDPMHGPQALGDDPIYGALVQPRAAAGRRRVLLAEDDHDLLQLLARVLQREGYEVVTAEDGVGLLAELEATTWADPARRFGAVVADVNLPGLGALEVLAGLGSADAVPTYLARAIPARSGAAVVRTGELTPYDAETLATEVIPMGPGTVLEVTLHAGAEEDLRLLRDVTRDLERHGIAVRVRQVPGA